MPRRAGVQFDVLALLAVAATLHSVPARYAEYGFGGVVLVARGNRVILHRGYGLADRERKIPNTPATRFPIASITKSFTAAAILQLADAGKLALDDPIPPHGFTIRQLLTHTSGLPPEEDGATLQTVKLKAPPGTKEIYSNFGYNVLATIVENASGEKFSVYVTNHLTHGLPQTNFEMTNIAVGYAGSEDEPEATKPPTYAAKFGSGAMVSTAADLFAWSKRAPKQFVWEAEKTEDGRRVLESGGDWDGYKSDLRVYPDDGVTIVVLANVRPNTMRWNPTLIRNLERVLFKSRIPFLPPHVGRASARPPTGNYGAFRIKSNGEILSVQALTQPAVDVLAYPHGQRPNELRDLDDDTRALLDILQAADQTKIASIAETQQSVPTFATWWQQRIASKYGALKAAIILGTAPKGPSRWETYVKLDLERGAEMVRVVRRRGTLKLTAIGTGGDAPFAAAFRPIGGGAFASFDVPAEEIVTLTAKNDAIVVRRGETEVRATLAP